MTSVLPYGSRAGALGRAPRLDRPELSLTNFVAPSQIATSATSSADLALAAFPDSYIDPLGNMDVGDCVLAAIEHGRMAKAFTGTVTPEGAPEYLADFRPPHAGYTLDLYYGCGTSLGYPTPPGRPGPDEGLPIAAALEYLRTRNIIEAYVQLPLVAPDGTSWTPYQLLNWATSNFRAVVTGVYLPTRSYDAWQPFGTVWQYDGTMAPNPQLSHALARIGYNGEQVVYWTWGSRVVASENWESHVTDEAWAVVTREDVERLGGSYDSLLSALSTLASAPLSVSAPSRP